MVFALLLGVGMLLAPPAYAQTNPLAQAKAAVEQSDWDRAERLLLQHLAAHPEDAESRFLLARVYSWHGKARQALAEYQALLKAEPRNSDYLFGMAMVYKWSNQPETALKVIRHARAASPARQDLIAEERALEARLAPPPAPAAPTSWEAEAGAGYEVLTNGYAPWQSAQLSAAWKPDKRRSALLGARYVNRFSIVDGELFAAAGWPTTAQSTVGVEATVSPASQVVPRWSLLAQWNVELFPRWTLMVTGRQVRWPVTDVTTTGIGLEHYVGPFRLQYDLAVSPSPNWAWPFRHQAGGSWYWGDRNAVSAYVVLGNEVEQIDLNRVLRLDVFSLRADASWWLTPRWALVPMIAYTRQGSVYDRFTAQLALRTAF